MSENHISKAICFCPEDRVFSGRIVGTILAALIAYEIVATVYNQGISVVLVFLFVAAYFATRGMSYLLRLI